MCDITFIFEYTFLIYIYNERRICKKLINNNHEYINYILVSLSLIILQKYMSHSDLYIRNTSLENIFLFFVELFVNLSRRGNGGIYFLKIGHMGINENPRLCCSVATSMTAESAHDFPAQRIFTIIRHIYNEHVTRRTICFSCAICKGRM